MSHTPRYRPGPRPLDWFVVVGHLDGEDFAGVLTEQALFRALDMADCDATEGWRQVYLVRHGRLFPVTLHGAWSFPLGTDGSPLDLAISYKNRIIATSRGTNH